MHVTKAFRLLHIAIAMAAVAALLPGALTVRAQEVDDPIPACTVLQLLDVASDAAESMTTISDITLRFETDDTFDLLIEFDEFYLDWWTNVQPELPDCALAIRYERLMARALGQIYIVLVWSAVESDTMLVGHPELLDATTIEILEFNELFTELTERVE